MTDEIRIGTTLYRFDQNRRRYRRDASGRPSGPPIYAEHFERGEVVGETRASWICRVGGGAECKVNKKTMLESAAPYGVYRWYTEQAREDDIWIKENRHALAERVRSIRDVDLLRGIKASLDIRDAAMGDG